jgi:hypothetical protein
MLQGLRPAPGGSGRTVNPLKQMITSMALMGVVFSANVRLCADAGTFLILLFTTGFMMVALAIMPDTYDVRQRNMELLHSKPISHRTHATASTSVLFFYAFLIAACFSFAPLIATRITFGSSLWLIAGTFLMLHLGTFAFVVLWLMLILFASMFLSLDRLRSMAQLLLIVAYLGTLVASGALFFAREEVEPIVSLTSNSAVRFLPSAWFATFLTSGFDPPAILQRMGVVILVGLAILVSFKLDLRKSYPNLIEKLTQQSARPARRPLSVRLLSIMRRTPIAGRRLIPDQAFATASLILTAGQREEASRMRTLGPTLMLIVSFVAALVLSSGLVPSLLVTFYGFMLVVDGSTTVKSSSHSSASWLFHAIPIDPAQLIKGVRIVILLRYFALAGVLGSVCLFLNHPPLLATVLSLGYLAEASLLITLQLGAFPTIPLSQEVVRASTLAGMGVTTAVQMVSTAGYFLVIALVDLIGAAGLLFGVAGLVGLITTDYWCKRWAAGRLARIEYA